MCMALVGVRAQHAFDAKDWNATSVPAYHENQFGAAVGLLLMRNKLFLLRTCRPIALPYTGVTITTVPSLLERPATSPSCTTRADGRVRPHPALSPEFQCGASPFPNNNLASGMPGFAEPDRAGGPQPASETDTNQRACCITTPLQTPRLRRHHPVGHAPGLEHQRQGHGVFQLQLLERAVVPSLPLFASAAAATSAAHSGSFMSPRPTSFPTR